MTNIGSQNVGRIAERIVANELEARGFRVSDLNKDGTAANADLLAVSSKRTLQIQVKVPRTIPRNAGGADTAFVVKKLLLVRNPCLTGERVQRVFTSLMSLSWSPYARQRNTAASSYLLMLPSERRNCILIQVIEKARDLVSPENPIRLRLCLSRPHAREPAMSAGPKSARFSQRTGTRRGGHGCYNQTETLPILQIASTFAALRIGSVASSMDPGFRRDDRWGWL